MGNRHKSREFALQLLYAIDVSENTPSASASLFWETLTCTRDVRQFADSLVFGVHINLGQIDEAISRYSEHWSIDRMTSVDRNILRMAVFELLFMEEIPSSVTINEAVEIGKKFGSEDSGAFVNGVLDKISKERKENDPGGEGTEENQETDSAPPNLEPALASAGNESGDMDIPNPDRKKAKTLRHSEKGEAPTILHRKPTSRAGTRPPRPAGAHFTVRKGDRF